MATQTQTEYERPFNNNSYRTHISNGSNAGTPNPAPNPDPNDPDDNHNPHSELPRSRGNTPLRNHGGGGPPGSPDGGGGGGGGDGNDEAILALANGQQPRKKKKNKFGIKPRDPDHFDGGAALDYFEPYINELDHKKFDFLQDWDAFVQKLANQFGSYTPEDDDENAIHMINFPENGKAMKYFIEFAKYQNRIKFKDCSLRHIVKTTIPERISSKLSTCGIATDTFDGMRQAIQKIDNEYWKAKQEEENRRKQLQQLQACLNKTVKGDPKTDKKNPLNSNTMTMTTSTTFKADR
ncbi:hypothetical protein Clacol_002183 [Clathrus columnatus]|uniref:Gag protein n=1 Tax=Clathrus columnatus TaxID=1419009 RepID=A0AAV5A4M5_9AGAM|nr:hypothetical protein Clacol_002183 [Clathrus columnatus]